MNTDNLNKELRATKVLPELDLVKDAGNVHYELDIKPATETATISVKVKL
jgi:hypothetical protein